MYVEFKVTESKFKVLESGKWLLQSGLDVSSKKVWGFGIGGWAAAERAAAAVAKPTTALVEKACQRLGWWADELQLILRSENYCNLDRRSQILQ